MLSAMSAPIPEPEPASSHTAGPPASPPNEIVSALISARALLIGAVIALVAAAVGALITGGANSMTADKQIAATDALALTNFIRTQRQTAYSAFISDLHNFQRTKADFVKLFNNGGKPTVAVVEAGRKQVDDAFTKFGQDISVVEIVGSQVAAYYADKIEHIGIQAYNLAITAERLTVFNASDAQLNAAVADLGRTIINPEEVDLEMTFSQQARIDVGNN
jgi:hypothetical protein